MVFLKGLSLFLLWAVLPEIHSLRWSSGPDQQVVLHACAGTTLSLPWSAIVNQGESIDTVRWFYSGRSDELIATYTFGNFFATPTFSARAHRTTNAGIDIDHVTALESGNYSVEVVVRDSHGGLLTLSRFVIVSIEDDLQTTDGHLHVVQDPVAEYNNQTGQYHVALRCGTFTYPSNPPFSATWQTPTGQQVASSSYANGKFSLLLPNPVIVGSYVCSVPPGSACIHSGSGQAVLTLDTTEARLAVLEAQQRHLEARNGELEHENSLMKASQSSLQTVVNTLQTENSGLNTKVNTLQTEVNTLQTGVNTLQTGNSGPNTIVTNLQTEVNTLQTGVYTLQTEVNTLQTENSNLKFQVSSLQTSDTALRHRMDTVESLRSKRVTFHAKFPLAAIDDSTNYLPVSEGDVIFPVVANNEGNGYSAATGRFTAPFAGTYYFVATASVGRNELIRFRLVGDSQYLEFLTVAPLYAGISYQYYGMGSISRVIHLNAGQQIWLHAYYDSLIWSGSTMFGGFLISAD